jgi:hypothetical protein
MMPGPPGSRREGIGLFKVKVGLFFLIRVEVSPGYKDRVIISFIESLK